MSNRHDPNLDTTIDDSVDDTISCIRFSPTSNLFAVASWDNFVRCYRYYQKFDEENLETKLIGTKQHNRAVLCCCWNTSGSKVLSGGCDNEINAWDIGKMCKSNYCSLGNVETKHKAAVKCLEYSKKYSIVLSGSWDKTVKIWDLRSQNNTNIVCNLPVHSKVYAMSCKGNHFIVGTANGNVYHCDFRKSNKINVFMKSSGKTVLKKQLRDLDIFPNEKGFAAVSIGGRCAIKHFNQGANAYNFNPSDFSFKCHRHSVHVKAETLFTKPGQKKATPDPVAGPFIFYQSLYEQDNSSELAERWLMEHGCFDHEKQTELEKKYNVLPKLYDTVWEVYSVNTIRFNRKYNFFATGGDDGQVNVWDKNQRCRLKRFDKVICGDVIMPITCIDFDRTEDIMAYAVGYNWHKGYKYWSDKIKNARNTQIRLHRIKMT